MFFPNSFVALAVFAAPLLVRADVEPTVPAPGAVYDTGAPCPIGWTGDPNSTTLWKSMDIELMSGSNLDMQFITSNYRSFFILLLSQFKANLFFFFLFLFSRRHGSRWYRRRYIQLPMSQRHTQLRHLLLSIRLSSSIKRFLGRDWAIRYRFILRCNHTTSKRNSTRRFRHSLGKWCTR